MPISALPTPPSSTDPANFAVRTDAFLAALPTLQTEVNSLISEVTGLQAAADATAAAAEAQIDSYASAAGSAIAASVTTAQASVTGLLAQVTTATQTIDTGVATAGASLTGFLSQVTTASASVSASVTAAQLAAEAAAIEAPWGAGSLQTVTGTTVAAAVGMHYILTNVAASVVTLPASPAEGNAVWVTAANGLQTNSVARNTKTIMGLAEDLVLDIPNRTVGLRYLNTSWRIT